MDNLTSPPETLEETVTDVDFLFVGGLRESITLLQADMWAEDNGVIAIHLDAPKEEIVYYKRHIIGTRTRKRVLRRIITPKKEKA